MTAASKRITHPYFENLDGLRFLCFLSVFFYHSFYTESSEVLNSDLYHFIKVDLFGNGFMGVNFFFVLSGFLITSLLIIEKASRETIAIPQFWIRRILRIWPLYFATVFIGFVVFPFLKSAFGGVPNETANILYYVTFLNNFDLINSGLPDASILGVLWSVAIEEQFYFFWPILLWMVPLKRQWILFIGVVALSVSFRMFEENAIARNHHTLSCIGDMAVGALAAWAVRHIKLDETFAKLSKSRIWLIYIALIAAFFFRDEIVSAIPAIMPVERLLLSLIFISIILEQNYSEQSLFKMHRFKRISQLGLITYGLYCLHFLGILVTTTLTRKFNYHDNLFVIYLANTAVSLAITIAIAHFSFKFFESPFLKLKSKFTLIKSNNQSS